MNYIEQYYEEITSGRVVVSKKIRSVYAHLVYNLQHPGEFHFNKKKANHAIDFIEMFCHLSKGKTGGKLIVLELWQKALISAIFGFVDKDNLRQYREVLLLVGRKNGKSALDSAISLYMLIADNESAPEVYSAATQLLQSKIVWTETVRMIKKSPELRKYLKCRVADIYCALNEGIFRPLASDSNSLDGLNASLCIADEIHAWKDTNLYDVLVDSQIARRQPLLIITSTAGFVRESIYDLKYQQAEDTINGYEGIGSYVDERFLPIVYELDDKEEWKDFQCWQKANPALGTIKDYQQLAEKVNRAKSGHKDIKDLLTKDFNLPETSSQSFLDWQDIKNTSKFDVLKLKPRYGIGGFDLSQTTDLTSACVIFRVPDDEHLYVLTKSWITSDALERREQEDKVPYKKWIEKDYLRVSNGHVIDYRLISQWFEEVRETYDIYMYKIGYDRYSASYLTQEMQELYGDSVLDVVIQGAKTLSIPLQNMKAELQAKNIVYNNNPLLQWCLANLRVKEDVNANLQPTKNRSGKLRDDAAISLLCAYTSYLRFMEDYLNII